MVNICLLRVYSVIVGPGITT